MHTCIYSSSSFVSKFSISLSTSFALKNSLSKETSLLVILNVFLFDCSLINSSNGNSRGTKREAEAMFAKHKRRAGAFFFWKPHASEVIWVLCSDWLGDSTLDAVREADWTYRFLHMWNIANIEFYFQRLRYKILAIYIINILKQ